jgi:hypothetical protein
MAYLAEQRITTVGGRAGALTGDADLQGNPYVQFDSGALYSVPRDAIPGLLVHTFDSTGEAYDYSQASDAILDGDVLLVPEEGIAAVLYRAWPVAVNEPHDVQHGAFHGFNGGHDALAADDGGRYAESVRRAKDLIDASAAPADTRPANDRAPQEAEMASPAGMPAVTAAIGEINDRLGYPRSRPNPCPAHMVHDYMPIDGITVTGAPYSGDRTQRLHIAGVEVGVVGTAPVTGSSATCLLPHQPGRDLRLFGCASPGAALNGLQHHVLTAHRGTGKSSSAAAQQREFPLANPLADGASDTRPLRRPPAGPAARALPATSSAATRRATR